MGETFVGSRKADGRRFAIAVARFNDFIVDKLLEGARGELDAAGAASVDVAFCPGAFELPVLAKRLAASGRYDAVVAIGCVIRGGTPHFEHVAGAASSGLLRAGLDTLVPVSFGVLTVDTIEQAIERAGTKLGNKGREAAAAAVEMATLFATLPGAR
jgi:6,7-dimethyl-8-ribityllumazine synthase